MIRKIYASFNRLSIFGKILFAFIAIIVVPAIFSLIISFSITEKLIVSQTYKDALSNSEIVSISISNAINEIKNATLYLSNNETTMDYFTILNKRKEELDGKELVSLLEHLRKLNGICDSISFTRGIDTKFTLLSVSGNIAYTNLNASDDHFKKYLEKYDSHFIRNIDSLFQFIGIEEVKGNKNESNYFLTWVKTVDSKYLPETSGIIIVNLPVDEVIKLMKTESVPSTRVLLDKNMKIIASTEPQWLTKSFKSVFNADIPENGQVTLDYSDKRYLLTNKTIADEEFAVVDIKPLTDISVQFKDVSKNLLLFNFGIITIFILVSVRIARGISIPLKRLSIAMQNTDLRVKGKKADKSTRNEVELLEQNFDKMKQNIQQLLKENLDKEKEKREAELKALYAQISPHFLFNTLNSVRRAVELNKKEKASEIILALINLLKITLKSKNMIPLSLEIENLKNYIKILQMRHGTSFSVEFNIPEILSDYEIPKLLLQPIVENSIIHAFEGLNREGLISINAEMEPDKVIIYIYDNGKGLVTDPLKQDHDDKNIRFSSIGVKNVNQRIKAHYGEEYGIKYESIPGVSTTAIITLPAFMEGESEKYDKDNYS